MVNSATPTGQAARPKYSLFGRLRRLASLVIPLREQMPENAVLPGEAVASFLGTMSASAERTYARWQPILESGLAEYLSFDGRKDFFEHLPVEDYYFAGVVAL